jgi:hypothetical protein
VKAVGPNRPAWTVIQSCGNYLYNEQVREHGLKLPPKDLAARDRLPTPREMRCMTYLALAHGATGIIIYYYKDIKLAYDSEVRWAFLKALGEELKKLEPVLLAPQYTERDISGNNPQVHWRVKEHDGKLYVLAVNASTEVQSLILKLPRQLKRTSLLSGVGLAYGWKDELLLTLDGYEAVAVELN